MSPVQSFGKRHSNAEIMVISGGGSLIELRQIEAGAEILFVDGPQSLEKLDYIGRELPGPLLERHGVQRPVKPVTSPRLIQKF